MKTLTTFSLIGLAAVSAFTLAYNHDRFTVRVESHDGEYASKRVELGREARVRIVDRLSDARCEYGRSWGFGRDRIWVDHGCRAVFEVDPRGNDRDNPYDRDRSSMVTLQSHDRKRAVHFVNTRGGVRLVKRLSDAPCRENRDWGYTGNFIWVDNGCRAVFEYNR